MDERYATISRADLNQAIRQIDGAAVALMTAIQMMRAMLENPGAYARAECIEALTRCKDAATEAVAARMRLADTERRLKK